jgi:anti-sigma regulatory factor (Ser/Thr protein kinase)
MNGTVPVYFTKLHLKGNLTELPKVQAELEKLCPYLTWPELELWLMQVTLAVTEAVSNIIKHAYSGTDGTIECLITMNRHQLQVDLYDSGMSYDVDAARPVPSELDASDLPESGYGLPILCEVMDTVRYERLSTNQNHWHLTCRVPAP